MPQALTGQVLVQKPRSPELQHMLNFRGLMMTTRHSYVRSLHILMVIRGPSDFTLFLGRQQRLLSTTCFLRLLRRTVLKLLRRRRHRYMNDGQALLWVSALEFTEIFLKRAEMPWCSIHS